MALSSDEIIKREIIDTVGDHYGNIELRIFPQSSRDDQKRFSDDGLTFGYRGIPYGSCDACWYIKEDWKDGFGRVINKRPIIVLEGTDALRRGSTGNAQTQRFHHVLGAVKNGLVGIYYLKKGPAKIRPDLYGMAYYASKVEKGNYLVTDDLRVVRGLLENYGNKQNFDDFIKGHLEKMHKIFNSNFQNLYNSDWKVFAQKRSTIIKDDYVIKYAGRGRRNFTEGSQRAGHIAVGEMYLTKYYFYDKKFYYLFPKMTRTDLRMLDKSKSTDKEWFLLRNEPNVFIKTIDDIEGISGSIRTKLRQIKDKPLKGSALRIFKACMKVIVSQLENGGYKIK